MVSPHERHVLPRRLGLLPCRFGDFLGLWLFRLGDLPPLFRDFLGLWLFLLGLFFGLGDLPLSWLLRLGDFPLLPPPFFLPRPLPLPPPGEVPRVAGAEGGAVCDHLQEVQFLQVPSKKNLHTVFPECGELCRVPRAGEGVLSWS